MLGEVKTYLGSEAVSHPKMTGIGIGVLMFIFA